MSAVLLASVEHKSSPGEKPRAKLAQKTFLQSQRSEPALALLLQNLVPFTQLSFLPCWTFCPGNSGIIWEFNQCCIHSLFEITNEDVS